MRENPKIQYRMNKPLDKKMCIEFLGCQVGGVNFANGIFNPHPNIKKSIYSYIDSFYKKHDMYLRQTAQNFEKQWMVHERTFFQAVAIIFNNHPWPKGKYIGYLSIFDCNPRFLHNKTFQIFYMHKMGPVYVTAHELLHFMFYDYVEKKRSDVKKRLNEDGIWKLSEIVNDVVMNYKKFKQIFCKKGQYINYPELKKNISKVKRSLHGNIDIDKVIDQTVYELSYADEKILSL